MNNYNDGIENPVSNIKNINNKMIQIKNKTSGKVDEKYQQHELNVSIVSTNTTNENCKTFNLNKPKYKIIELKIVQPSKYLCELDRQHWNDNISDKNPLWNPIFTHFAEKSKISFNLNDKNLFLGGGSRSRVFLGQNHNNKSFAVKFLIIQGSKKLKKLAKKESLYALNVKSKYFVNCNGCFEYENYIAIVYQLCINKDLGSLINYLKDNYSKIFDLEIEKMLKENFPTTEIRKYWLSTPSENFGRFLIWQILDGLQVLRSLTFLHKDLKLENLLVTKNFQIKICDFSYTELLKEGNILNLDDDGNSISNYMSPLYFQRHKCVSYNNSYKIDYYALGVNM